MGRHHTGSLPARGLGTGEPAGRRTADVAAAHLVPPLAPGLQDALDEPASDGVQALVGAFTCACSPPSTAYLSPTVHLGGGWPARGRLLEGTDSNLLMCVPGQHCGGTAARRSARLRSLMAWASMPAAPSTASRGRSAPGRSRISSVLMPATMASGLPLSVPAWYMGPAPGGGSH